MTKQSHSFSLLLLGMCLLLVTGLIAAQGTDLGTIRGHIADAQGGAVPGAKIKLSDLSTGNTMEVTSDGEGNYQAVNLRPGEYKITITFQGFSTVEVSGAIVRGSEVTHVDARLNPGRVAESITVTAEAPAIQTDTPAVTATLASRELLELPRDSRDFFSFLYLNPNITMGADGGGFKFIGAQSYGASFTLDGLRSNGGVFGEPTSSQPSLEVIGDLTVLSNNFSAEYAGVAGIRVSTRRGTKDYHGSMFYNSRNSALAAWQLRDKVQQATFTPTAFLSRYPTPYFNLNEMGGSFGGPMPWGGRKKTFFNMSYEKRIQVQPAAFSSSTLPHPLLWVGDFTRVSDSIKPVIPAGITLTADETANNTVLVGTSRRFTRIPQRLLNPSVQALIRNYFPQVSTAAPISAGTGRLLDYYENRTGTIERDLGTIRVDHDFSDRNRVNVVYNTQLNTQATARVVNPFPGLGLTQNERNNHTGSVSWTRVLSERVINELRGGFNFQYNFRRSNHTPTEFLKSIGWDDSDIAAYYGVVSPGARDTFGHLAVSVTGFAALSNGGRNTYRPLDQFLYTIGDTLTWVKGRHNMRMGFDLVRNSALDGFSANRGNPRGSLAYTGGTAGDRWARLILGLPATTVSYVEQLRGPMDVHNWEHGYYVQDDFRVHNRLTLYLGLRYELVLPFVEASDLIVNFDPNFTAGGKRGRFIVPSRAIRDLVDFRIQSYGVATAEEAGVGRGLVNADKNNFAPRLGAAFKLTDRSVLRGGYGFFYPTSAAQGIRDAIVTNAFNQGRTKTSPAATPLLGWPGPAHGFTPLGGGVLRSLGSQPSANAVPFNLAQPRIEQYNVTYERELPWRAALRASYLGTQMHGLIAGIDLNMLPPSDTPFGTTTGDGVTACTAGSDCDLSDADRARLPFPLLGDYLATYGNLGNGRSNALQLELSRHSGTLTFNLSYTLLDQQTAILDTGNSSLGGTTYNQFRPARDFGTDSFISRHRFIAYGVWNVPFGHGRKFGPSLPKAADLLLGGWQTSWQMFIKSGTGFTPYWTCDNCAPAYPGNLASGFLDAVGGFGNSSYRPRIIAEPNVKSGDRIWDPNAFALPTVGADALDNAQVAVRNSLRGPGTWGTNFGIKKDFRITERVVARLGAEFNNVFNHPLLSPTDAYFANLGSFAISIDPATKRINPLTNADITFRDPNFGRLIDSIMQESIENRRTTRLSLRIVF